MRVTVLTTRTNNTPPLYEPLRGLGHELSVIVYDALPADGMDLLPQAVEWNHPDMVVLVGAHEAYHPWPVPKVDVLARIGSRWPLVHLCCDGAEPVWWEQIQRYYDHGHFALQVNIDGVRTGPIGERGLTLLSPFDPANYPPPPAWETRSVAMGFGGNEGGGERGALLRELTASGVVQHRKRDPDGPLSHYLDFLGTCRAVWNHPETGSNTRMHVKGRPLEAALMGAVVVEAFGSPLRGWFEPGKDYIEYKNADDVREISAWVGKSPDAAKLIAGSMRRRVLREHAPAVFWEHVISRMPGRRPTQVYQPPMRDWHSTPRPAAPPPPAPLVSAPVLVLTRGHINFVQFEGEVFAVPQSLGVIDIADRRDRQRPGIRRFPSLDVARSQT